MASKFDQLHRSFSAGGRKVKHHESEIISRWCHELAPPKQRLNAVVASIGSELSMTPAPGREAELEACLGAASLIGLGEWWECGFGRIGLR